jgi:hypothetical protein
MLDTIFQADDSFPLCSGYAQARALDSEIVGRLSHAGLARNALIVALPDREFRPTAHVG